jgi:hypothetical protein
MVLNFTKSILDIKNREMICFINICSHEFMEKPRKHKQKKDGNEGYSFELPYRVSKPRHDQDNKKEMCSTFDVIFNPEVLKMIALYKSSFLHFVCDTAIDGVNRVVVQDHEKVSNDYKVMRNLKCKGGKPAGITVKIDSSNPIINAIDPSKHETNLQKRATANEEK